MISDRESNVNFTKKNCNDLQMIQYYRFLGVTTGNHISDMNI